MMDYRRIYRELMVLLLVFAGQKAFLIVGVYYPHRLKIGIYNRRSDECHTSFLKSF